MIRRALRWLVLFAPLAVFAVIPLGLLVLRGLGALGETGDDDTLRAMRGTLWTSGGAAVFAFALGLPLALMLERTNLPGRRALLVLFTLPAAVPSFIFAMGWVVLANPRAGALNRLLGPGTFDIYGTFGIAFVLGVSGLPLVLLAARAALVRMDASLEEAARLCGAGRLRTLLTITLPIALPWALSGAALVFLFSASAFGVPYLLGVTATPATPTLTTHIYMRVLMGPSGLASAGALALWLLTLAAIVIFLTERLGKAGRVPLLAGKGARYAPMPLQGARLPAAVVLFSLALALVVAPLSAVALASVQPGFGQWGEFTLAHWTRVFSTSRVWDATFRSAWLSAATALIVTAFGLTLGVAAKRWGRPGRALQTLASFPYAVPGTVLALALLITFSRDVRFILLDRLAFVLALGNSLALVGVAWVVKELALGVRQAREGLAQVDGSLAEASRVFGASPLRAFTDATLPQLYGPLGTALLLTFLACFTEMTQAVLLAPAGVDLLGSLLFEWMSYADPSGAAVISCAFTAAVGFALFLRGMRRAPSGAR